MDVICIANNKGGVTKSTTTINLGYGLARAGRRVLIVDTDPQCNTTYSLTGQLDFPCSLFHVLLEGAPLAQALQPTQDAQLALLPGSIDLSAADLLLSPLPGREYKLARALGAADGFDYVLIDTPPNLGLLTVNAFVAATRVLIPVALTTYALLGMSMLETTLAQLRANLGLTLPVLGVVATLDDHTTISRAMQNSVRAYFGELVFQTVIPRNIKVEEAHNHVACLYDYAPGSTGALAYHALVEEVLCRVETAALVREPLAPAEHARGRI